MQVLPINNSSYLFFQHFTNTSKTKAKRGKEREREARPRGGEKKEESKQVTIKRNQESRSTNQSYEGIKNPKSFFI